MQLKHEMIASSFLFFGSGTVFERSFLSYVNTFYDSSDCERLARSIKENALLDSKKPFRICVLFFDLAFWLSASS